MTMNSSKCQKIGNIIYDYCAVYFRQIAHYPEVIEGCSNNHLIHLNETKQIKVRSPFYDLWMASDLAKHKLAQ